MKTLCLNFGSFGIFVNVLECRNCSKLVRGSNSTLSFTLFYKKDPKKSKILDFKASYKNTCLKPLYPILDWFKVQKSDSNWEKAFSIQKGEIVSPLIQNIVGIKITSVNEILIARVKNAQSIKNLTRFCREFLAEIPHSTHIGSRISSNYPTPIHLKSSIFSGNVRCKHHNFFLIHSLISNLVCALPV